MAFWGPGNGIAIGSLAKVGPFFRRGLRLQARPLSPPRRPVKASA